MPDRDRPGAGSGGRDGDGRDGGKGPGSAQPTRSLFADDPDMADILDMFVREMPERIAEFRACWDNRELDRLTRLAHQLKGAGGGYGFPALGAAAGKLEHTLKQLVEEGTPAALPRLRAELDALLELCRGISVR